MLMENQEKKNVTCLPARAKVVILGAGLTGLVTARELMRAGERDILLIERDCRPGGLLKTNRSCGLTIDEVPHIFFTKNKRASAIFREMVGPVYSYRHRLGVMWKGGYVDFPFQNNINQLDLEDRKSVLHSLLEQRFKNISPEPRNLEEFAVRELGSGIVDLFFRPYNEKLWQTPLSSMGYKWLSAKICLPGAAGLADSILGGHTASLRSVAPHTEFVYPRRGGIESLVDGLLKSLKNVTLVCGSEVLKIDTCSKTVNTSRGKVRYCRLVSTLPLDRSIRFAGLRECYSPGSRLRATKVVCLQYVLAEVNLPQYHWIYVPDPAIPFYRLTRVDMINPGAAPGAKALLVECACPFVGKNHSSASLASRVTTALIKLGIIKKKDIKKLWVYEHFPAYPVPHAGHGEDVPFCLRRLEECGVISAGRFGEWSIYNMDHSIEAGISAAAKTLL
jgi:protoporphyrinogen oxidase